MKYLKIAALFSLINAIFFGAFLYVLSSQNLNLKPQEPAAPAVQEQAEAMPAATTSPGKAEPGAAVKEQAKPASAVKAPVPPAASPVSDGCVVTISGQKYDVANFRSQHPGGDIFVCGTDMTRKFFSQHDQELLDSPKMASLKVK